MLRYGFHIKLSSAVLLITRIWNYEKVVDLEILSMPCALRLSLLSKLLTNDLSRDTTLVEDTAIVLCPFTSLEALLSYYAV